MKVLHNPAVKPKLKSMMIFHLLIWIRNLCNLKKRKKKVNMMMRMRIMCPLNM